MHHLSFNEMERLQSALDYQNAKAREEDCIRRLENRKLVIGLENARRTYYLECWGGDLC